MFAEGLLADAKSRLVVPDGVLGPVVDPTPWQHAFEMFAEGLLADAKSRLVVPDCVLGPVIEDEVSQGRVGIQATKDGLAEIHQDLVRARAVAGILAVVG